MKFFTCLCFVFIFFSRNSFAEIADAPPEFEMARSALDGGDYEKAISIFEKLEDLGVRNASLSFNRGLAYTLRVHKTGKGKPGDLGKAAAAFEESLHLNPKNLNAVAALEKIRKTVDLKLFRANITVKHRSKPISQVIAFMFPFEVWGVISLCASILVMIGLIFRKSTQHFQHLLGTVIFPFSLLIGSIGFSFMMYSKYLKDNTKIGVVISDTAEILDENGVSSSQILPETSRVECLEYKGRLMKIRWEGSTGWVLISTIKQIEQ